MKTKALCIFIIIISTTSSWAQNHKLFCDKNGKYLKEEGTITNGKKEGYWKFYSCFEIVANRVQSEGLYKNDLKIGLWKEYDDVTLCCLAKRVTYVDGVEEGEFTEYYRSGEMKYKGFYVKGKKKGEGKEFYKNGKIKEIENFDTGEITQFFENGKVEKTGFVKYGEYLSERSGEWKEYYENGKLKSIGIYSSGNRTGKWQLYHDNGQLSGTGIYKDDVPLPDSWTTYNRSGQKDGINIPQPQEFDYKVLCAHIGTRAKASTKTKYFTEYAYEQKLLQMACFNLDLDDEEVAKKKLQIFWSNYKTSCKCDALSFQVQNGNLLKFALSQNMPEVIETLASTYGCDINFIDPADGLNLLDYILSEISRLKKLQNSENSVKVYEEYKESIIGLGGKSNKK